jgi:hypothetical protein
MVEEKAKSNPKFSDSYYNTLGLQGRVINS